MLRVALAQVNATVGDLRGNEAKIADFLTKSKRLDAHLVVFPELAATGYPPEDLLFKPAFIRQNQAMIRRLVSLTRGVTTIIGFADRDRSGCLYNAAAVASNGHWVGSYHKMMLPNYGVFDEKRYFTPGKKPMVLEQQRRRHSSDGHRLGLSICEDIWVDQGPCQIEAAAGSRVLINISASPYHAGKHYERERLLARRARAYRSWICYVNLVGGQDELIFDGGSLIVTPAGKIVFRAPQFNEGLFLVELPWEAAGPTKSATAFSLVQVSFKSGAVRSGLGRVGAFRRSAPVLSPDEEIFQALVLGTRDYVEKNGFSHVVLGMSGGIDSALTAAIAVAALGKGKVTAVSMPSRYSSLETRTDARAVAEHLGIAFFEIPIERLFEASLETLRPIFANRTEDVTEQNLQARIRGMILMALSNKFNWLVLSTGNKSEVSTGYCTLYGDMVGGFAVIKDVPKTWVYKLSRTANRFFGRKIIPDSVFTRPPTAELKPNQRDQDTLPVYEQLDRIVKAYVEEDRPAVEIQKVAKVSKKELTRVLRMIDFSEYKRRQAAIGIKITPRAFGKDRRVPITNRFREQ